MFQRIARELAIEELRMTPGVVWQRGLSGNVASLAAAPLAGGADRLVETARDLWSSSSLVMSAHFLRIQTPHVTGPASSLVIGRPATLRASFI